MVVFNTTLFLSLGNEIVGFVSIEHGPAVFAKSLINFPFVGRGACGNRVLKKILTCR
jgi:hypothetical protein